MPVGKGEEGHERHKTDRGKTLLATDAGGQMRSGLLVFFCLDHNRKGYEPRATTSLPSEKGQEGMGASKKLSDVPPMNDDQQAGFWEKHEPEEFMGWEVGVRLSDLSSDL